MGIRKVQTAWAMYDWANSVYSLVIGTAIFPIYYDAITRSGGWDKLSFLGYEWANTALYTMVISFSFLTIGLLSPYLSALADISGKKKTFMRRFVLLGSISCMSLFFFTENYVWIGLICAYLASIGFSGSLVFYNAFLPEIAEPEEQDKLSAKGFALGYIGSSLLLIMMLVLIEKFDFFGLPSKGMASRISFLIVGLWWLLWSAYSFKNLPSNVYHKSEKNEGWVKEAYSKLIDVFKIFIKTPRLARFCGAFFFYSSGVQSVILLATLFGTKVLGLESSQLIITVLLIQFVAVGGAWLFAFLSGKIGNIKALGTAVVIWVLVCIGAYFIQTENQFYLLGAMVGMVMGGIQAISRSTFSKMLPETEDHATYFSFYDVSEKLATMFGMLVISLVESFTGDLRNAAIALTLFFFLGMVFLFTIPKSKFV